MRSFFRIIGGFTLIGVGLIMAIPGVPGPGILVIVLGLVVLAEHYHWARRWLHWAKSKFPHGKNKMGRGSTFHNRDKQP